MVARVVTVRVDPERLQETVEQYEAEASAVAEQEVGFMGALLLSRPDGQAISIDLCDTAEHLRANERRGFYQAQVAKFAERIVDRPRRDFYDVKVAKGAPGGPELLETIE